MIFYGFNQHFFSFKLLKNIVHLFNVNFKSLINLIEAELTLHKNIVQINSLMYDFFFVFETVMTIPFDLTLKF